MSSLTTRQNHIGSWKTATDIRNKKIYIHWIMWPSALFKPLSNSLKFHLQSHNVKFANWRWHAPMQDGWCLEALPMPCDIVHLERVKGLSLILYDFFKLFLSGFFSIRYLDHVKYSDMLWLNKLWKWISKVKLN